MSPNSTKRPFEILAPAKINLYLHVTGRRNDGYHCLDSLVSFADTGDIIKIEPSSSFSFRVQGPFAKAFTAQERGETPNSSNLAVKAVWRYAEETGREPDFRLTLVKNMPLAAGIGGGSSDAAAVLWGLSEYWGVSRQTGNFKKIAVSLGADVPVCVGCTSSRMRGIGDILDDVPPLPEVFILLVNPGMLCDTASVFSCLSFSGGKDLAVMPSAFKDVKDFITFLMAQENDLQDAAQKKVPEIGIVLDAINGQQGCLLARMSGSGATCFGLFADGLEALDAAESIQKEQPSWWVRHGLLNNVARY